LKILKHKTVYPLKQIYTTLFALIISLTSFATTITAISSSDWATTSTWDLDRVPENGDTIVIPQNISVSLTGVHQLDNMVIIIRGTLDLTNGKLRLDDASRMIIHITGFLTGANNNDQLTIGGVFKFKGAGTAQTGYSFADNTTGTYPSGFVVTAPGTLPVTFQSFYVTRQGSNNQLSWSTSEERNNNYYAIEKSTDARNWKQIAIVTGAGTSSLVNKYGYTDKNSNEAIVYYRIRQVDMNGAAYYSAIRTLRNNETAATANIYASSNKTVTIDFNSDVKDNVSIQLINMSGQVIVRKEFSKASYRLIVDAMSAGSGVYVVRISDSKGWSEVKKIML
jgi:hypothetical protein